MTYQLLFESDADPSEIDNRLESSVQFRTFKNGEIQVQKAEGSITPYNPIDSEKLSVSRAELNDNDVIICKFPSDFTYDEMQMIKMSLDAEFEGHKVLMIMNDLEIMSQSPNEAIDLLEKMIAHIRITAK